MTDQPRPDTFDTATPKDDLFRRDPRRPAYCHAFAIRSQRPGRAPAAEPPYYASKADAEADAETYRRQWRGRDSAPSYSVIEVYTSVQGLVRGTRAKPLFGLLDGRGEL